jgi:hypothetical protein
MKLCIFESLDVLDFLAEDDEDDEDCVDEGEDDDDDALRCFLMK